MVLQVAYRSFSCFSQAAMALGAFHQSKRRGVRAATFYKVAYTLSEKQARLTVGPSSSSTQAGHSSEWPGPKSSTIATSAKALAMLYTDVPGCGDLASNLEQALHWMRIAAATNADPNAWLLLGDLCASHTSDEHGGDRNHNGKDIPISSEEFADEDDISCKDAGLDTAKRQDDMCNAVEAWTQGAVAGNISCILRLADLFTRERKIEAAAAQLERGVSLGDPTCVKKLAVLHSSLLAQAVDEGRVLASSIRLKRKLSTCDSDDGFNNKPGKGGSDRHSCSPDIDSDPSGDSTNPWSAHEIVRKYLKSNTLAAVEFHDPFSLQSLAATKSTGLSLPPQKYDSQTQSLLEAQATSLQLVSENHAASVALCLRAVDAGAEPNILREAARLLYTGSPSLPRNRPLAVHTLAAAARAGGGMLVHAGDLALQAAAAKTHTSTAADDADVVDESVAFELYQEAAGRGIVAWFIMDENFIKRLAIGCDKSTKLAFDTYEEGYRKLLSDGIKNEPDALQIVERLAFCLLTGEGCMRDNERAENDDLVRYQSPGSPECKDTLNVFHTEFECHRFSEITAIPSGKGFAKLLASADAHLSNGSTLMADSYDRSTIIELARWLLCFCIRIELENELSVAALEGLPKYSDFLELVGNIESLSKREISQLHGLHYFFSTLKPPKSGVPRRSGFSELFNTALPEPMDLIKVISIRQCNGFGIWDRERECLGHAVYPAASFFNHSCDKNLEREILMKTVSNKSSKSGSEYSSKVEECNVQLRETSIRKALDLQADVVIRAKKNIKKGEIVTLSYVDPSWNRENRQQYLKDVYYFDCLCVRCENEK
ncbi:SET and MYND domain-containing protein 3 [Entophlyctis luteolus]|nr:SET and MYND domain-containing protein 3 [Entophlyctis luteolus]